MAADIKSLVYGTILLLVSIAASIPFFGVSRSIDSQSYIELANIFSGKAGILLEHFAARPLVPALASLFLPFFEANIAFGIVNTIFICLTTILLFILFSELFKSQKLGFVSALFYPLSFPIILLGSQVLTDAAGNFFLVLAIYFIEFKLKNLNLKNILILSIIIAFALLARDSSFFIFIYLAITLLINRHNYFKKKLKSAYNLILLFIISLLPLALWKYLSNVRSYPALQRILSTIDKITSIKYLFSAIIRSAIAFHILWIPAIYGLLVDKDKPRRIFYLKVFLTIMPLMFIAYLTLAQNYNYDLRHTFALFPLIFPLAAFALNSVDSRLNTKGFITYSFIVLYALISLAGAFLVPDTPIRSSLIDLEAIKALFK